MMRLSKRQKLLAGALGLAGTVWVLDSMLGRGVPTAAAGATAEQPTVDAARLRWNDIEPVIAELTVRRHESLPTDGEPSRDLFMPVADSRQCLALTESKLQREISTKVPAAPEVTIDFAELHVLDGVALGRRPVAMVDGRLLALGAELDGYRLSKIERDRVVFDPVDGGSPQTLWLPTPDSKAAQQ